MSHMPTLPSPTATRPLWRQWILLLSVGGLFCVALILMLVSVLALHQSQFIIAGVQVQDLDVSLGGQTVGDATVTLSQHWQETTIILETPHDTQTVPASQLGFRLDVPATVARAHQQGRSLGTLYEWATTDSIAIEPVWSLDSAQTAAALTALASRFAVSPVEASLRIADGRAEAIQGAFGQVVDVPATTAWIAQHTEVVIASQRVPVILQAVEPAVIDVRPLVIEVNQYLAQPLTLYLFDPVNNESLAWDVDAVTRGDWVVVADNAAWQLDAAKIEAYLTAQASTLGDFRYIETEAVTAAILTRNTEVQMRVYHTERPHIVSFGETLSSIGVDYGIPYPWIEQANPNLSTLTPGQEITIPSPDALLPLPLIQDKRVVIDLSDQKMWAYENNQLKWEWTVSTGIPASPTAPGVFQVQTHVDNAYAANWDLWMPHFIGIYRPVPTSDFMNGFHGFPSRNNYQLLWTDDLGHPVTYGCILVDSDNAADLYTWAEAGMVVEIKP